MNPLTYLGLASCVLIAATVGGLFGIGTASILLPILSYYMGVRFAVPVVGIGMIFANVSRAIFSWRSVDWKAVIAFSSAAVPTSIIGALIFVGSSPQWIGAFVGITILVLVPLRRLTNRWNVHTQLKHLPIVGGTIGMISGMGGATGPVAAPFLISYGLVKSSYLGTDGVNATLMHSIKTIVYWMNGSVNQAQLQLGLVYGAIMVLGSYLGRRLVDRLNIQTYTISIECCTLALGSAMLLQTIFHPK